MNGDWRVIETELVNYFRMVGAEIDSDGGNPFAVVVGSDGDEFAVSLTDLARVLADELTGVL